MYHNETPWWEKSSFIFTGKTKTDCKSNNLVACFPPWFPRSRLVRKQKQKASANTHFKFQKEVTNNQHIDTKQFETPLFRKYIKNMQNQERGDYYE